MGAVLLTATGCVTSPPPGVRVGKTQTDIVFGAPIRATARPTPTALPSSAALGPLLPPPILPPDFPDFTPAPRPTFGPPPSSDCPPAALGAFPAAAASTEVMGTPREGRYRWKQTGTDSSPGSAVALSGFQQRAIRRVTKVENGTRFQLIDSNLKGDRFATTFLVKPASTTPTDDRLFPVGISLVQTERLAADGTATLIFQPVPSVLYLPLPVVAGGAFSAQSVDTVSGLVVQSNGQVLRRERVDACGDVIDGWFVQATQSFSPQNGMMAARKYDYIVATQLGGVLIGERIVQDDKALDATFTTGQLDPDPLPERDR